MCAVHKIETTVTAMAAIKVIRRIFIPALTLIFFPYFGPAAKQSRSADANYGKPLTTVGNSLTTIDLADGSEPIGNPRKTALSDLSDAWHDFR